MKDSLICILLVGETKTEERAQQIANKQKSCPYIHFIATKGSKIYATIFIPAQEKWWAEYIEESPQKTLGLQSALLTFVDRLHYPTSMQLRLPETSQKIAPCGSNCGTCPSYERCSGCPATSFYKREE